MQKFLKCHFGYCQFMDLRHLRNIFGFTQAQFCQNSHTKGTRVTFLDVTKCWKPIPIAILGSPEGWCIGTANSCQLQCPVKHGSDTGLRLCMNSLI